MSFKAESFRGLVSLVGIYRTTTTPGSVTPGTGSIEQITVPGVRDTDFVLAEIESASGTENEFYILARADGADTIRIIYNKTGAGAADPGTVVIKLLVLRIDEDWLTVI